VWQTRVLVWPGLTARYNRPVSRPREPIGGASEASRLLHEGLELLAERTREADAAVQHAQARSQRLIAEAEERAQAITAAAQETAAAAERSRAEVEQQLTTLRAEIADARKDLAQLKAAHAESGRGGRGAAKPAAGPNDSTRPPPGMAESAKNSPAAATGTDAGNPPPGASRTGDAAKPASGAATTGEADTESAGEAADSVKHQVPPPLVIDASGPEAAETARAPRWGRPSSIPAVQASRVRSSRPRWLPPWLPFVIILLASVGIVTATVGGQAGAGGQPPEASGGGAVILLNLPTGTAPPASTRSGLAIAAATTLATSVVVAASSVPQASPSRGLVGTPLPSIGSAVLPAASRQPTTAAGLTPTARATPPSTQVPPPQAQFISPIPPPGPVKPDMAIVGAYTAYTSYVVHEGDTLNGVAAQFGVSGDTIVSATHLADPNLLQPGQVLTIPRDSGWLYRVQPGDTTQQLAQRYGVSVDALVTANALPGPDVHAGDLVLIPTLAAPAPKQ
jgi:LysM repeat protein